jgi:hypothetical protein
MAFTPISGTTIQYQKTDGTLASGYFLKLYNTSNVAINMYSTGTGTGALAKCQLDSAGYPLNGSSAIFTPFTDQEYKIALYTNATDADADTTGNADWFYGPFPQPAAVGGISAIGKDFATLALAVASTEIVDGDVLNIAERASGNGGGATWDVVLSSTVTENTFNIVQGTGVATLSLVLRGVGETDNSKQWGSVADGSANDSAAIDAMDDSGSGVLIADGTHRISSSITISSDIEFGPDASFTVDTGITVTISGGIQAGINQEIFSGLGSVVISKTVASIHWFDTIAQSLRSSVAQDTLLVYKNMSWAGANITKNTNFYAVGREYIKITGSFTMTGVGGNSTFNNMDFSTPSSGTTLATISGVGGMNFRDCQLNPGAGNLMFLWDRDGTTPQIVELMQTKFISGKLCQNASAGQTHTFHVKESSLFSFTEADTLTPFAGSFISVAIYNSLVNVNNPQISSTSNAQLRFLASTTVDDNTTNVAWYDNNGTGFDTLEISDNCTMAFDSAQRFIGLGPNLTGSGVTAANTNWQTVPSANLLTFDADLFEEIFYEGTATPLAFVQSWVMKAGAGQFQGQKFKLHIHGSIDTQGNNVVMFGRTFSPASEEMQGLTVEGFYDGTSWTYSYSDIV